VARFSEEFFLDRADETLLQESGCGSIRSAPNFPRTAFAAHERVFGARFRKIPFFLWHIWCAVAGKAKASLKYGVMECGAARRFSSIKPVFNPKRRRPPHSKIPVLASAKTAPPSQLYTSPGLRRSLASSSVEHNISRSKKMPRNLDTMFSYANRMVYI